MTTYELVKIYLVENGFECFDRGVEWFGSTHGISCKVRKKGAQNYLVLKIKETEVQGLGCKIDLHHPDSLPELLKRIQVLLVVEGAETRTFIA